MRDLIDRAAAQTELQFAARRYTVAYEAHGEGRTVWSENLISVTDAMNALRNVPAAEPTLYGYNIEHLELIARVLQKENLPPERIVEALTDIGRIVAIVRDEFEEMLRRAVEVRAEDDFCSAAERRTDEQDD